MGYDPGVAGSRRWILAIAAVLACAQGGGNESRGSGEIGEGSESTTNGTESGATMSASSTTMSMNCVPGMQVACACPGGADGAQPCLPDGSGYAACECPSDESSSTSADGGSTTTAASSESSTGGCSGSCNACSICSTQSTCSDDYQACVDDKGCSALINCAINCGLTDACTDACVMRNRVDEGSFALFEALRACVEAECGGCMED